jgi:hypothetical protein
MSVDYSESFTLAYRCEGAGKDAWALCVLSLVGAGQTGLTESLW